MSASVNACALDPANPNRVAAAIDSGVVALVDISITDDKARAAKRRSNK
jgi:hypothetical protein